MASLNTFCILPEYNAHMKKVPTFGGILLNATCDKVACLLCSLAIASQRTQVVLVSHQRVPTLFSFPKGKINQNEDPINCAIREVSITLDFISAFFDDICQHDAIIKHAHTGTRRDGL